MIYCDLSYYWGILLIIFFVQISLAKYNLLGVNYLFEVNNGNTKRRTISLTLFCGLYC